MNQYSTYKNILFLGDITGRLGRYIVRDLIETIKNRRSIRKFENKDVDN